MLPSPRDADGDGWLEGLGRRLAPTVSLQYATTLLVAVGAAVGCGSRRKNKHESYNEKMFKP